jgi:hypothetical protein
MGFEMVQKVIAMPHRAVRASLLAATVLCASVSAMAQPAPPGAPPPPPPPGGQSADQGQYPPDQGQYSQGQYNVPPPPGYQPGQDQEDASPQAREQDERYSYAAEQWAAQNCVAAHARDTTAGAVIGGILGAIIGSGLSGRYDRGAGMVVGGALGATAGGAVGAAAADNNPNCPPGYVMRAGAPAFYPGPVYGGVVYAAPGWYDPWIWYGGHWIYRPYPYHRYWYHAHHR